MGLSSLLQDYTDMDMKNTEILEIVKSSGDKNPFSLEKLQRSLEKSGAGPGIVNEILHKMKREIYPGMTTAEIHKKVHQLLKEEKSAYASKYKLKKALYELGPTGFPFERFIAQILKYSGYTTHINKIIEGRCVSHEVDIVAGKEGSNVMVECKFHGDRKKYCNVKVPLYIDARYRDISSVWNKAAMKHPLKEGWVVTNTRFTADAITYGKCTGLYLLSWDYPAARALKDRIDELGLYPITVSDLLSNREKQFLLSREIVLLRQLKKDTFYLDHLEVSPERKDRIMEEIHMLCPQEQES
ncbi:ATP cone domain-containing protein [Zeaxanthinibacter sp. PT1]|uniref:ATP cone domain-containing protein n=1 Tax=Zeaxanthinibacter TaxID=561554 RepID=UPI00234BA9E9|nr:ATP cone domain-containing protein [Zeaxanthinibacter sp. PT1]MDC6351942.1 ATP cone domain-containing protein [Zeaxanthinibacter sp. PT1]